MPMDVTCYEDDVVTVSDELGALLTRLALLGYPAPIKGKTVDILWFHDMRPDVIIFYTRNFVDIVYEDSRKIFYDFDEAWEAICAWVT